MKKWFDLAKTYPLEDFIKSAYGLEFNNKHKCLCPFHADSKPSLSIRHKVTPNTFKCFPCGSRGTIIDFVMLKEGLESTDAAKWICSFYGEEVEAKLSPEEEEKAAKRRNKVIAKNKQDGEVKAKELLDKKNIVIKECTALAPKLEQNLYDGFKNENKRVVDEVARCFPNMYMDFDVITAYVGWCYENDSIVTMNRRLSDGTTYNLKYYQEKDYSGKYRDGKWISRTDSTTVVMGTDFLKDDGVVFVVEGEKDMINLQLIGCNAITLGGASTGWDEHLEVLRGRDVIVWYDHDKTGYTWGAIAAKAIESVAKTCLVTLFYYIGDFPNRYDVSDYLAKYKIDSLLSVMDKITYSSFYLNNTVLEEIIERNEWTDLEAWMVERLESFKTKEQVKTFVQLQGDILKYAQPVRGSMRKEIADIQKLTEAIKKSPLKYELKKVCDSLFPPDERVTGETISSFEKLLFFKEKQLQQLQTMHVADVVDEVIKSVTKAGYSFATYRGVLYIWTGNYFYAIQNWEIESFVLPRFMDAAKVHQIKKLVDFRDKIIENIGGWSEKLEAYIDPTVRVVNMLNGVIKIRASGKFLFRAHHQKDDCAMNLLEFNYDENAVSKKWEKFLERVVPDKGDRDTIEEFIGYCLLPSHRFESFLYFYGPTGANGKSVILEIIRSFFSRDNVSSLELSDFQGHSITGLVNKVLNIGSEVNAAGDMKVAINILKALTSTHDTVHVDPKNKDAFVMYPEEKPKCAFAANKKLKSGADDSGLMRRALVIHFDQEILDDEKIRNLVERFEGEKTGILNVALKGLARLVKNGKFTMSERRADFMKEYRKEVSPVRAYVEDNLVKNSGVCVPKQLVYEHYKKWCELMGHTPYTSPTFWQKAKEIEKFKEKRPNAGKFISSIYGNRPTFMDGWCIDANEVPEVKIGNDEIDIAKEEFTSVGFVKVYHE